jgi:NTE family protein
VVDYPPWGDGPLLAGGTVTGGADGVVYRGRVRVDGQWWPVDARRELTGDGGFLTAWTDAAQVEFTAGGQAPTGTLRLGLTEAAHLLASVEPVGAHGLVARKQVLARFAGKLLDAAT